MVKASKTSYGKSSEKLNWDAIVSKKGETRVEHIKRHTVQNNSRETHSVFNGNPIDMVNDAWEQRLLEIIISDRRNLKCIILVTVRYVSKAYLKL